jgi:hypothetical protein
MPSNVLTILFPTGLDFISRHNLVFLGYGCVGVGVDVDVDVFRVPENARVPAPVWYVV